MRVTIPMRLPSLNEYINECRKNKFAGSKMKKEVQADIGYFLNKFPAYKKPIYITFTWIEENRRRDYDNVCFAKKFILDALQQLGKIPNDNSRYIIGFMDKFKYADESSVIVEIEEGNMNKYQRELIDSCIKVNEEEELPLFERILVIETKYTHDSGYKIMYVIGETKDEKYYLLDSVCDVVNIGLFKGNLQGMNIDIAYPGVIRLWNYRQQFKCMYQNTSSCIIEVVRGSLS